jgi:hypothetical protein
MGNKGDMPGWSLAEVYPAVARLSSWEDRQEGHHNNASVPITGAVMITE